MKQAIITLKQLDKKIKLFSGLKDETLPTSGWVYSISRSINMSLRQLSERLSITPQSVKEIEEREKKGTVSLNVLRKVAAALDMKFVYGFIPNAETLDKMIEERAEKIARQIVERTSISMSLEDQKISDESLENNIKVKTEELKRKLPRMLWD